jgi:hypothetical protein
MQETKYVTEPSRKIPVIMDVDVAVAGAGAAGVMAALAAAKAGASVVLVERFGSLGGLLTIGLNTKPSGPLIGGLPKGIWDYARAERAAGEDYMAETLSGEQVEVTSPCDPELMKIVLAKACQEAGVTILFETWVAAPIMEGGVVQGLILESKGGRQALIAKVVVDATADGDVAAMAGVPYTIGSDEGVMQPVSMFFKMGQVDIAALAQWAKENPQELSERYVASGDLAYGIWLGGFTRMLRKFQDRTGIRLQRESIHLKNGYGPDEIFVNATRVVGTDPLSPQGISASILECYSQIPVYARFLKEDVPGFANAYISGIPPFLGVRETRHIHGEYTLSGQDVESGAVFADSVGVDNSAIDVHHGTDVRFEVGRPYEIPYRCLIPKGVEGLLLSGRSISADHGAHGRTRNMPACFTTGQAAGFAAAVAALTNSSVRNVDISQVQELLRQFKMPIKIGELE